MRYLRGQRGTRNASLQTVIAIGSITLGVSALVVVLGVMNGLRNDLRDRILIASPHMRVLSYGPNLRIDNWRTELKLIEQDPDVVAAAPEVASQSLVQNAAAYPEGVFVSGLEPGRGHQRRRPPRQRDEGGRPPFQEDRRAPTSTAPS